MRRGLLVIGLSLFGAGCADRIISIRYSPPTPAPSFTSKLVVRAFADARGTEGDRNDPLRVGGGYGQCGNRVWKVMNNRPWLPILIAELRAQGVDAVVSDQSDALVLEGGFATSPLRFGGITSPTSPPGSHSAPDGRQRLTKKISAREQTFEANFGSEEALEKLMNVALKRFAETLASDPDIKRTMGR